MNNRTTIRQAGGISPLVTLLTDANPALVVNTCAEFIMDVYIKQAFNMSFIPILVHLVLQ